MKTACPFISLFCVDCMYLEGGAFCENINLCPVSENSWCFLRVKTTDLLLDLINSRETGGQLSRFQVNAPFTKVDNLVGFLKRFVDFEETELMEV